MNTRDVLLETLSTKKNKNTYVRFKYTQEDLQNAVNLIIKKEKSLNQVHRETGIPKSTLSNKINNKVPMCRKMGPKTILTQFEENKIASWILAKAKVGFPVHPENVKDSIQSLLKDSQRENPFSNDRPGIKWFKLFMNRHKDIAKRHTEVISKARAAVTEHSIRQWFSGVLSYLDDEGSLEILNDSRRVINCDETGLQLCPKSGKVLGPKKMQNFYEVANSAEKENITVLCTYSADGCSLPPMIIYPYKRIPCHIVQSLPDNWAIGRSDSGWMVAATFYEYIANVMYPWLVQNKIEFPVILFVDGHKSHLSLELSDFCSEKKILLYCLPPNATHILQPCDVSIFKPLKSYWKDAVKAHHQISKSPITKNNFGPIFKKAFDKVKRETIVNGFKACGLFPFDPEAVDYNKCISTRQAEVDLIIQEEQLLGKPSKEDYVICQKVIQYVLRNHKIEEVLNSEPCLKEVWYTCESVLGNGINNISEASKPFNILDMPIEIEGSDFNFNHQELQDLDVSVLDMDSLNDEQTLLNCISGDICNNKYSKTSEDELPYTSEEHFNIKSHIDGLEMPNLNNVIDNTNLQMDIQAQHLNLNADRLQLNQDVQPLSADILKPESLIDYYYLRTKNSGIPESVENTIITKINTSEVKHSSHIVLNDDLQLNQDVQPLSNDVLKPESLMDYNYLDTENSDIPESVEKTVITAENISQNASPTNILEMHFKWPKEEKNVKNKKRPPTMYAITSSNWKKIQREKEEQKVIKDNLVIEKRNARLIKKIETENKKNKNKLKKQNIDNSVNNLSSSEQGIPIMAEEQSITSVTSTKSKQNFAINDHVIVQYEGEYFPGIITLIKNKEYKVSIIIHPFSYYKLLNYLASLIIQLL